MLLKHQLNFLGKLKVPINQHFINSIEYYRKDLISAMKLPDSEPLSHEEYWIITDQWKQEWERGVQVPVNPDSLPEPSVRLMNENYYKARQDFKL